MLHQNQGVRHAPLEALFNQRLLPPERHAVRLEAKDENLKLPRAHRRPHYLTG
jgi:hypothetical protein